MDLHWTFVYGQFLKQYFGKQKTQMKSCLTIGISPGSALFANLESLAYEPF